VKISPLRICYTTPGLRPLLRPVSAPALYRFCRMSAMLSLRLNPHTKRFLRPLRSILARHVSAERLAEICRDYLVQRKYLNHIEAIWRHLAPGQRPAALFDGAEYLHEALSRGGGAVLISGHNYGFSRMVGPILAEDGYQVCRAGSLGKEVVLRRWGPNAPWEYIYLPKEPWERVRALRQLIGALKKNRVVHLLIVNRPAGDPALRVEFYGQNFFLDPGAFELIGGLGAPVLPCFALCDERGAFKIRIDPPLGNSPEELSCGFLAVFSRYLREAPEYVRFWKPLLNRKPFW